jgi:SpoVK/Ycf46/Vps4 family AAA+-type ATPase
MNNQESLEWLIHTRHPLININTHEEDYALELVRSAAINTDLNCWLWSVDEGVRDALIRGCQPTKDTEHPAAAMYFMTTLPQHSIFVTLDLAGYLHDEKNLRLLRNLIRHCRDNNSHLIMIDHQHDLPSVITDEGTRFDIALPDEEELEEILRNTLRRMHSERRIEVNISRRGLHTVIRNLRGLNRRQAEQVIIDTVAEDRRFNKDDINTVLARKRQALHRDGLLEYVEAPVDLQEIGGLRRLKQWLEQREHAMSDEAADYGLKNPRGVLMLGVQGAGKSLCAKAIATAWRRPLLRMDVGGLYDRYVGESEKRLRDALAQAGMMAPVILWIDEIEKAFASAASRSTDGGLSQRMFGSLLTWMQEHPEPVFLVATANDIEALPPELLRKGRFDEIFFVDLPREDTRRQIFAIHLKKRKRNPDHFDLDALADASEGYSGAEIEQAIISALHQAFAAHAKLDTERILTALRDSPPLSVTMAEKVAGLREWAKKRCVPAD